MTSESPKQRYALDGRVLDANEHHSLCVRGLCRCGAVPATPRRQTLMFEREEEGACYGFLEHEAPEKYTDSTWMGLVQQPFRGIWLWLFGTGCSAITSLMVGTLEQLTRPVLFKGLRRKLDAHQFRILLMPELPSGRVELNGWRCQDELRQGWGMPALVLPACAPGTQIRFAYAGRVQGVVLVGSQIP